MCLKKLGRQASSRSSPSFSSSPGSSATCGNLRHRFGPFFFLLFSPRISQRVRHPARAVGRALGSWRPCLSDADWCLFGIRFFAGNPIPVAKGYIVYATVFEATVYITLPLGGQVCVGLLAVLLGLQVFWFSLIVKLAISTKVKGEAIRDNRILLLILGLGLGLPMLMSGPESLSELRAAPHKPRDMFYVSLCVVDADWGLQPMACPIFFPFFFWLSLFC